MNYSRLPEMHAKFNHHQPAASWCYCCLLLLLIVVVIIVETIMDSLLFSVPWLEVLGSRAELLVAADGRCTKEVKY